MVIAIDGPSASGKSTVAGKVADSLGYTYLDTGAMYRKAAAMALEFDVSVSDSKAIVAVLYKHWSSYEPKDEVLRSSEVTAIVSEVSAHKEVRDFLIDLQREFAERRDVVMDGRDIGTVVFPNAELKFYLDASAEVRARRRIIQNGRDFEVELESIRRRDQYDSTRKIGPLKRADDAVLIDTTGIGIEEVVEIIVNFVKSSQQPVRCC